MPIDDDELRDALDELAQLYEAGAFEEAADICDQLIAATERHAGGSDVQEKASRLRRGLLALAQPPEAHRSDVEDMLERLRAIIRS